VVIASGDRNQPPSEASSALLRGKSDAICRLSREDRRVSDVAGGVIVPTFAEPHVHLDRAFSAAVTGWNRSGSLDEAVARFHASVDRWTVESLAPGGRRALGLLYDAGVGHLRTHTAVGGPLGFRAWEAVETAAAAVPGVDVLQVAMPIHSELDDAEIAAWVRESAARGAVAVGGAPWRAEDPAAATRAAAGLAAELGIGLDLHVDETDDPSVDTLGVLTAAVTEFGLEGRATAHHCCSLARRPEALARAQAEALAAAGVAVVVCPVSNLSLQGRVCGARGLAPIRWLRDAGVTIGIGLDNIRDFVVSVGTADPLRAAWLVAVAGHLTGEDDLEWLGRTVTAGNRRICGLPEEVKPGGTEELLLIEATSLAEAVALVPPRQRLAS
jgi:cytosine/creatinine deaminase